MTSSLNMQENASFISLKQSGVNLLKNQMDEQNQDSQIKIKLNNSLRYWDNIFKSLMRPNVVIMVPLKEERIFKLETVNLLKQLIKLKLLDELEGMNSLTNTAYTYLRFNSKENAAKFQNNTDKIDDVQIHYLQFQGENKLFTITMDLIPPLDVIQRMPKILESLGMMFNICPSQLTLPGGKKIETSPTTFSLKLNKNKTLEDIPYFIMIDAIKIYLTVKGRKNPCYNCGREDHMAKDCSYKFCQGCRTLKIIKHKCIPTYASKVKINTHNFEKILQQANLEQFPAMNSANRSQNEDSENGIIEDFVPSSQADNNWKMENNQNNNLQEREGENKTYLGEEESIDFQQEEQQQQTNQIKMPEKSHSSGGEGADSGPEITKIGLGEPDQKGIKGDDNSQRSGGMYVSQQSLFDDSQWGSDYQGMAQIKEIQRPQKTQMDRRSISAQRRDIQKEVKGNDGRLDQIENLKKPKKKKRKAGTNDMAMQIADDRSDSSQGSIEMDQ